MKHINQTKKLANLFFLLLVYSQCKLLLLVFVSSFRYTHTHKHINALIYRIWKVLNIKLSFIIYEYTPSCVHCYITWNKPKREMSHSSCLTIKKNNNNNKSYSHIYLLLLEAGLHYKFLFFIVSKMTNETKQKLFYMLINSLLLLFLCIIHRLWKHFIISSWFNVRLLLLI
jgi:hypothetical protein